MEETRFDPRRRLCPDGGCIGVIGPDGLCKVCGRPSSGVASVPPARADADAGGDTDGDGFGQGDTDSGGDGDAEVSASPAPSSGFDPQRRLCDDGACVGIVGADGLCRVCGRRAEG